MPILVRCLQFQLGKVLIVKLYSKGTANSACCLQGVLWLGQSKYNIFSKILLHLNICFPKWCIWFCILVLKVKHFKMRLERIVSLFICSLPIVLWINEIYVSFGILCFLIYHSIHTFHTHKIIIVFSFCCVVCSFCFCFFSLFLPWTWSHFLNHFLYFLSLASVLSIACICRSSQIWAPKKRQNGHVIYKHRSR